MALRELKNCRFGENHQDSCAYRKRQFFVLNERMRIPTFGYNLTMGVLISFFIFLAYPLIIIKRIKNEETVLEKELEGYTEYQNKVKYRLLWGIW